MKIVRTIQMGCEEVLASLVASLDAQLRQKLFEQRQQDFFNA